jgi:predicted DNA-binding ribbon-helix-helix protein
VSDAADSGAAIRKHSITIAGHGTSISLEDAFWTALKRIAQSRGLPLSQLVAEADRTRAGNLSSALRVLVLRELERGGGSV